MLLRNILDGEGYAVLTAPEGATGLVLAEQAAPGLILLDLQMPVLDGLAFLRAYRQMPGQHAAIVVMSAGPVENAQLRSLGADAFVSKPFDLDDVLTVVRKQLRTHALVS